ncbi:MAG: MotA/TolQ/ExbB proton channel family protein [Prevotella sp.]|nr:MotA/TolQ/ExbB proton channel family protein [Prevotella sp.]
MNTLLYIFFLAGDGGGGLHQLLKDKFVEGNVLFMSLVAVALILGLAFCIERIIYLTLSEINARRFVSELAALIDAGNIDEAKEKARNTVGPVASICYQGLLRINDPVEDIDRSMESYANVQLSLLEKGSTWIKLFIAIAPSLGFLGTVIGMVMAFEHIELAGDISPTIVAEGMKVALLTTIFGIIAAVILQLFYNFILTKIDRITMQMEESAVSLLDIIGKYKHVKPAGEE